MATGGSGGEHGGKRVGGPTHLPPRSSPVAEAQRAHRGWNQRNSGYETLATSAAPPPHRQAGPPWVLFLGERRGASGIERQRRGRWRATRGVGDGRAEAWFFLHILYIYPSII
ncbi:hypothetical protein BDA96_02G218400 [Sorghum bicolor]|uniref:Uncharacterized protein n=1 Tax=Sorghum bicolor TaxID=4558 RepID=A0A921UTN2_SORBI|nr:hypothetical protein BDA96_02G218400 [Sorghum bicolor]